MNITDEEVEEILACFSPDEIPKDPPLEARAVIEQFVDLVELLMRPLPLPPAGETSFKQPSSDSQEPASQLPRSSRSTSEVQGRDSPSGFEHR